MPRSRPTVSVLKLSSGFARPRSSVLPSPSLIQAPPSGPATSARISSGSVTRVTSPARAGAAKASRTKAVTSALRNDPDCSKTLGRVALGVADGDDQAQPRMPSAREIALALLQPAGRQRHVGDAAARRAHGRVDVGGAGRVE